MSCSKPLPPFVFDLLYYLNRNQLERFSIVCRPLKNFIERYFHTKPYRMFDELYIRGGSYALVENKVQWHPHRDDYSAQQFLAGQKCFANRPRNAYEYYSFAEMRPYLSSTVRIRNTTIYVAGESIYNAEHIPEMESLTYLWRDFEIRIRSVTDDWSKIVAEDFQPILNSPSILQCQELKMTNAHFSFNDYKVLYSVKVIESWHSGEENIELWQQYWQQFFEQPRVKPLVVFWLCSHEKFDIFLDRLYKDFSSAVLPNAFTIMFVRQTYQELLTEFYKTNKTSGEKLQLKRGLPFDDLVWYTLERSSI